MEQVDRAAIEGALSAGQGVVASGQLLTTNLGGGGGGAGGHSPYIIPNRHNGMGSATSEGFDLARTRGQTSHPMNGYMYVYMDTFNKNGCMYRIQSMGMDNMYVYTGRVDGWAGRVPADPRNPPLFFWGGEEGPWISGKAGVCKCLHNGAKTSPASRPQSPNHPPFRPRPSARCPPLHSGWRSAPP